MKKLLSVALVLALMLSLGVSAFAEVIVDGNAIGTGKKSVDSAQFVSAGATGDDLTVTGNVTGDSQGYANSVIAQNGAEITVGGEVTAELVWPGSAIQASNDSTKVTVEGAVTEKTNGNAINAAFAATVEAGSVDEKNDGDAINASSGAVVIVDATLTENDEGNGINASGNNTNVSVGGNVIETEKGDAINASGNTTVTVKGSVTESDGGHAIYAKGAGTMVTVNVSVTEDGDGNAIYAQEGATVIVLGDVTGKDGGVVINANDSTVNVGGNVVGESGKNAVVVGSANKLGAEVVIEGKVTGNIGAGNDTSLYLGQLVGNIASGSVSDNIHYLIGFEDDSLLEDISYDGGGIVEEDNIAGAKKIYHFITNTADATALSGKSVTLKPNDSNKILTVSGFDAADVLYTANEDGTVTFLIGNAFKGGMQNLKLILTEKPGPGPDPDPTPVICIVPASSVRTVEFQAPEGIEEGLITKLNSADHAGLTIDKSLLAEGAEHSLKVMLDGKELPAEAFRFCINADGSLSLTLSNTYLFSLGDGTYDLVATVDGLEIPFTVAVAK